MAPRLRRATIDDLDFAIQVDLKDEGSSSDFYAEFTEKEREEHRDKIRGMVVGEDCGAWVHEHPETRVPISLLLYRFRTRDDRIWDSDKVYDELEPAIFPPDGRFCEVFQLWVHAGFRRKGLATELKNRMEQDSRDRGVGLIYTHTEDCNEHVIELNLKLGYREVRRGPIWDEFIRVSLIKQL
jgi:ribosomal protein S18 acetylase RimI-like enzyme